MTKKRSKGRKETAILIGLRQALAYARGEHVPGMRVTHIEVLPAEAVHPPLDRSARPGLKELLLTDEARGEIPLPKRGRWRRRAADGRKTE